MKIFYLTIVIPILFSCTKKEEKVAEFAPPIIQKNEQKDSLVISNPIGTINRIFYNYIQYNESTDSPQNIDSLRQSLSRLSFDSLTQEEIKLLIDMWLYYSVTDFDHWKLIEKVLGQNNNKSVLEIEKRKNNLYNWETDTEYLVSELNLLEVKIMSVELKH